MATHSSVLAWRIPGTGSLVGCRLWGRTESDTAKKVGHLSLVIEKERYRKAEPLARLPRGQDERGGAIMENHWR